MVKLEIDDKMIKDQCLIYSPKEIYISYEGTRYTDQNLEFIDDNILLCGENKDRLLSDLKTLTEDFPEEKFKNEERKEEYQEAFDNIFHNRYNGVRLRNVKMSKIMDDDHIIGGDYDVLRSYEPDKQKDSFGKKWDIVL